MLNCKSISILLSAETGQPGLLSFLNYLQAMPHVKVELADEVPMSMPSGIDVLILTGEPLVAPLADSVKVVAILEAAARSMQNDGRLETLDG